MGVPINFLEVILPNWCFNNLFINGKESSVDAFILKAKGREHQYYGPFNGDNKSLDWGSFTPLHLDILLQEGPPLGAESLLCFHSLLPVPKECLIAPYDQVQFGVKKKEYPEWFNKYPNLKSGYLWEAENWGVKWGASDIEFSRFEQLVALDLNNSMKNNDKDSHSFASYSFNTPWGPPSIFQKVSLDFPDLTFILKWEEPGAGVGGQTNYHNGEVETREWELEEEDEDFPFDDEE